VEGSVQVAQATSMAASAPMTPKAKRRFAMVGGAVALVALLVVGGVVAVNVIRDSHGPQKTVESYLAALVAGDAGKAMEIGDPSVPNAQRLLLTNAVYGKAADRPDSFSIATTTITKDAAVVRAEVRQGGVKTPIDFNLVKKDPGFLDPHWSLQNPPMSVLSINTTATTVLVNGAEVSLDGGNTAGQDSVSLPAFPGTYTIALAATSKYLSADPVQVKVGLGNSSSTEPAQLTPEPNDAFTSAVKEQADAMLAKCTAQKVLQPAGCPFSTFDFGDVRNVVWRMTTEPTYAVNSMGGDSWRLSYDQVGTAQVSYEHDDSYGFGAPDWKKETRAANVYVGGTVTLTGDALSVSFDD